MSRGRMLRPAKQLQKYLLFRGIKTA